VSEWKPGDVAYLRYCYAESGPAVRVDRCDQGHPDGPHWHFFDGRSGGGTMATEIRRLVLIDPEDGEQAKRLADAFTGRHHSSQQPRDASQHAVLSMQAALREFASPTPRIEEPQGLGAVVEDIEGTRWVRVSAEVDSACHYWSNSRGHWNRFDMLPTPVRILSPGVVTPEGAS
jgi:hypothetical protein